MNGAKTCYRSWLLLVIRLHPIDISGEAPLAIREDRQSMDVLIGAGATLRSAMLDARHLQERPSHDIYAGHQCQS